jgi:hypothetical protein
MGTPQYMADEMRERASAKSTRPEQSMLAEFVQKLLDLAVPTISNEEGRVYSSRVLNPVQKALVNPIEVGTLTGFVDLYRLAEVDTIVHIISESRVDLLTSEPDEWNRRETLARAVLPSACQFRFGNWLEPEDFVIGLLTNFVATGADHTRLLKLVSNLASESVTIANDDGYSQQAVTRQGVVGKETEKVTPRMKLAPYRTFREVTQPTSEFVLRLRSREGRPPVAALFEADGAEWRNDAISNIQKFLAAELKPAAGEDKLNIVA